MNVLYIADPNSIHDIRWINFFAGKKDIRSYLIARHTHLKEFNSDDNKLNRHVTFLGSIDDPSTIRPWINWYNALAIKKLIKREKIHILHILYAEPNVLWANWKAFFGIRVIVTTRGSDILRTIPAFFKRSNLLSRIVAKSYRTAFNRVDQITCTSRQQIEMLTQLGISAPIILVRTGVDLEHPNQATPSSLKGLKATKQLIFMPRKMRPVYNHELTLDAIALLEPKIKSMYAFVFVNSDTSDRVYFKKIQERALAIAADIHFLPSLSRDEMYALYKRARLVVMNPLSDGSPVTAMEAMVNKVPVILPPLAYDKELFGSAFYFTEWSPASLCSRMQEILALPGDDLNRCCETNYQMIQQHGNTAIQLEKVFRIYNQLSNRP